MELFGKDGAIRTCLIKHARSDEVKNETGKVCEVVGDSFCLWDLVFKAIHKEDPTQEHCESVRKPRS